MAERDRGSILICSYALCFACGPRYYEPTHPQMMPWRCKPCAYSEIHSECWDGELDRVTQKPLYCLCPCRRKA